MTAPLSFVHELLPLECIHKEGKTFDVYKYYDHLPKKYKKNYDKIERDIILKIEDHNRKKKSWTACTLEDMKFDWKKPEDLKRLHHPRQGPYMKIGRLDYNTKIIIVCVCDVFNNPPLQRCGNDKCIMTTCTTCLEDPGLHNGPDCCIPWFCSNTCRKLCKTHRKKRVIAELESSIQYFKGSNDQLALDNGMLRMEKDELERENKRLKAEAEKPHHDQHLKDTLHTMPTKTIDDFLGLTPFLSFDNPSPPDGPVPHTLILDHQSDPCEPMYNILFSTPYQQSQ